MPFLLLMPSYNQAKFIMDAVESCLHQDDPDWELWILDNSTDATPSLFTGELDPRIHFEHIPDRMDPGSCLNLLLEKAQGDCFSYIHTDNTLAPGFVREMRRALGSHPLALAYCDLRHINESGEPLGICLRPEFTSGNLLGSSSLGVPFAARTALAKKVGGFSSGDLADDVFFCVRAFQLGTWTRVPLPLVNYRLHDCSRATKAGASHIQQSILMGHAKALPELEARGLKPLEAMGYRIRSYLDEIESRVEDAWLRRIGPKPDRVMGSVAHAVWSKGLLTLPGFDSRNGGPPKSNVLKNLFTREYRRHFKSVQREIRSGAEAFQSVLGGWAWLSAHRMGYESVTLQVGSMDMKTLWAAKLLNDLFHWPLAIAPGVGGPPPWLHWPTRSCDGLWIDFSQGATIPPGMNGLTL